MSREQLGCGGRRAAVHGIIPFHPGRRAPGSAEHFDLRVDGLGLEKQGENVGRVVSDGKVRQTRVRAIRGGVVVGIDGRPRDVGGAHGITKEADTDALRVAEERLHDAAERGGGDLLVQQVSRRIGHGSAEPLDGLFGLGFGNEYGWKLAGSAGCERNRRPRRHQRLLIVGGQPDADDLGACQRTARGPEAQRRES